MTNGQIPDGLLVTVEDDDRLIRSAANAFLAFKAHAASQNRSLAIAEPAGAYRSLDVQRDMHLHPERYNLNPASKAGLAAVGKSGHGDGNCVDLVGTSLSWIVANAGRFGFSRPLSNDPNHFRHDGITAAGVGNAQLISIQEDTDMYPISLEGKHLFVTGQQYITHITTTPAATIAKNILTGEDIFYTLSAADFGSWLDMIGVPRNAVQIVGANATVLDPISGSYKPDGVWSAELAYRTAGAGGPLSDADVDRIAQAVNVDAATRLAN